MLSKVIKTVFGSRNDRIIKKLQQRVQQINQLEPSMQALSDEELRARTDEFRQRYAAGETLDQLLNEAFATCREAAVRASPPPREQRVGPRRPVAFTMAPRIVT